MNHRWAITNNILHWHYLTKLSQNKEPVCGKNYTVEPRRVTYSSYEVVVEKFWLILIYNIASVHGGWRLDRMGLTWDTWKELWIFTCQVNLRRTVTGLMIDRISKGQTILKTVFWLSVQQDIFDRQPYFLTWGVLRRWDLMAVSTLLVAIFNKASRLPSKSAGNGGDAAGQRGCSTQHQRMTSLCRQMLMSSKKLILFTWT